MRRYHYPRTVQGESDGLWEIAGNTLFTFSGNKKPNRWQFRVQNTDVVGVTCGIELYYAYESLSAHGTR